MPRVVIEAGVVVEVEDEDEDVVEDLNVDDEPSSVTSRFSESSPFISNTKESSLK
jgi:hypothetical protein